MSAESSYAKKDKPGKAVLADAARALDGTGGARTEPREKRNQITLSQRMASACVGSVLTSLVVTPFDVVRIRLQQQEMLFPAGLKNTEQCCRRVFWEEAAPTVSSACVESPYCMENSCVTEARLNGTVSGIGKIMRNEGLGALYRGLGLTLLMAIPSNIVYFSGYDILRDSSPLEESHPVLNPLLCGASARILAATAVAPLELVKTRLQAVPSTQKNIRSSVILRMVLKNTWHEMKDTGLLGMFKGLQLTLWRDVPFSGIYWASYETLSAAFRGSPTFLNEARDDDPANRNSAFNKSVFTRAFLSGSLAGITAALFTNPFDVGKTRYQVACEEKSRMGTMGTMSTMGTAIDTSQPMFKYLFSIYRNEGFSALYVGIFPRCLKIAPSCAIMISTYEVAKRFFKEQRQRKAEQSLL